MFAVELAIEDFVWSFSRINSYVTCPKMFFLQYIDKQPSCDNAFSQWGSFGHSIFEEYYKGNLAIYELGGKYVDEYDKAVTLGFPHNAYVNLGRKYYNTGKDYFNNFDDPFCDSGIVAVEKEIRVKIGNYNFTGYIDLILKDETGFYIVDHKSHAKFKNKKEQDEYLRQLYLYAKYIFNTYGVYPYKLVFNMFRSNVIVEEKFDINKYEKAQQWVVDTIDAIRKDEVFAPNTNEWFCEELCGVRHSCECHNNKGADICAD